MKSKGHHWRAALQLSLSYPALPTRGIEWFIEEAEKLGIQLTSNAVDIGVRVEMPASSESITDVIYESKLVYFSRSFDDRVRHVL